MIGLELLEQIPSPVLSPATEPPHLHIFGDHKTQKIHDWKALTSVYGYDQYISLVHIHKMVLISINWPIPFVKRYWNFYLLLMHRSLILIEVVQTAVLQLSKVSFHFTMHLRAHQSKFQRSKVSF